MDKNWAISWDRFGKEIISSQPLFAVFKLYTLLQLLLVDMYPQKSGHFDSQLFNPKIRPEIQITTEFKRSIHKEKAFITE